MPEPCTGTSAEPGTCTASYRVPSNGLRPAASSRPCVAAKLTWQGGSAEQRSSSVNSTRFAVQASQAGGCRDEFARCPPLPSMEELRQQLHSRGGNLSLASLGIPDQKLYPERNHGEHDVTSLATALTKAVPKWRREPAKTRKMSTC